jgi:catalase
MEGFGVHTFRLVNAAGEGVFVKFHWKPKLGVHSLIWEECQQIAGKDPDFNRRDLWDAIDAGQFPEWELGVQLIPESDEFAFPFDLLDSTKLVPEERVPVIPVGRMVLDRNPDNFFAETEQVAFHTANLVPGIDFTNDPLLQFRNFSYLDTQLIRLGGPNFAHLPVNRPTAAVTNNQRDGYGQHTIPRGTTSYLKNNLGGGCPALADEDAFRHYTERIDGHKIRSRADSFKDHYSQPRMFWLSMSTVEQDHIVAAFAFELGKVGPETGIRPRVIAQLNMIDHELAARVAARLGVQAPDEVAVPDRVVSSPALSQLNTVTDSIVSRRIAVLAADGVDLRGIERTAEALRERGATVDIVGLIGGGTVSTDTGQELSVDLGLHTTSSALYDAVLIPGALDSVELLAQDGSALHFVSEAYKHLKPIAAFGAGIGLLRAAGINPAAAGLTETHTDRGVVTTTSHGGALDELFIEAFIDTIQRHRTWNRATEAVPA